VEITMSKKSETASENDVICNALECYETATEDIRISAGYFGIKTLKVCKKCSKMFIKCEEKKCSKKLTSNNNTI
jgi:hypothetical protein